MKIGGGYNSQNSSYNNTATTTKNLTPYQENLQPMMFKTISDYMTNPGKAIRPAITVAKNNVNARYSGLADKVRSAFLTTGGGKSGKMGQAMLASELARYGDLSDVDNTAAIQEATLPLSLMQLAEQWLGMNFGSTSTGSGSGKQSGWNVGASGGFGSSFGTGPNGPWSMSTWG